MEKKKNFYITTPIYYASGNIHIGHTYCCVCADTIARYKRLAGYNVRFRTGSDEHGQKIQQKAEAAGLEPKAYVDKIAQSFKDVWKALDISYDWYVRTTDTYHTELVQKVFTELLEKGDIYLGEYKGWYCTPDETFWSDSQVVVDEKGNHFCPDCHRPVHRDSEKAYFLNVKKFVPWLLEFYQTHPETAFINAAVFIARTSSATMVLSEFPVTNLLIPPERLNKHPLHICISMLSIKKAAMYFSCEDEKNSIPA